MSSNNKNSRIIALEERLKDLKLSEEEQAAFRSAKQQVKNHSKLGAFAGLLVGGYVSKVRKYTLGISIAICIGSVTMGSQIGFFTGTAAGIRTIKSLPNSQRIFEAIRDAQNIGGGSSRKNQEQEGNDDQSSSLSDEFVSDNQDFSNSGDEQSWEKLRTKSTPPPPSQDSWDKIREKSSASSTWDKIRQNNETEQQQQQQQSTFDRYNDGYSKENLPRSREDFEELYGEGKIRTNQYGDAEIRYE